jgi:hypothetical protein
MKKGLNKRQQEIVNQYNELSYCKTFSDVKLTDFKLYNINNNNRTSMKLDVPIKFMAQRPAQKQGYKMTLGINLPIDKVQEKINNNDQELLDLINEKIEFHHFKHKRDCNFKEDYESEIKKLIDEFNEISRCRTVNEFELSDVMIYKVSGNNNPDRSFCRFNIPMWGRANLDRKKYEFASVLPFSVELTKEKIANNDESLFRMIKGRLNKFLGDLSCDEEPTNTTNDVMVPGDPLGKNNITHTGPKDLSINYTLNEEISRIKKMMGLSEQNEMDTRGCWR